MSFSFSSSDILTLCSPSGERLQSVSCDGCNKNQSLVFSDYESEIGTVCLYPTPGYPNDEAGFAAFQASLDRPVNLRLNEVFVQGNSSLESCDWVELYNAGVEPFRLSDFSLSDNASQLDMLSLPDVTLVPGGYYLCELRDAAFFLNGENEELFLSVQGHIWDYVSLHSAPSQVSYGRGEDGLWRYQDVTTPGAANAQGLLQVTEAPVLDGHDGVVSPGESVSVALSAKGHRWTIIKRFFPRSLPVTLTNGTQVMKGGIAFSIITVK